MISECCTRLSVASTNWMVEREMKGKSEQSLRFQLEKWLAPGSTSQCTEQYLAAPHWAEGAMYALKPRNQRARVPCFSFGTTTARGGCFPRSPGGRKCLPNELLREHLLRARVWHAVALKVLTPRAASGAPGPRVALSRPCLWAPSRPKARNRCIHRLSRLTALNRRSAAVEPDFAGDRFLSQTQSRHPPRL